MLKKYIDRDSSVISSVNLVNTVPLEQNQMDSEDMNFVQSDPASSKLKNSDILKDLDPKLSHLSSDKRLELKQLILEYNFQTFHPKLTKFIMMLNFLMVQTCETTSIQNEPCKTTNSQRRSSIFAG